MKKIFLLAAAVATLGLTSCSIDNVENIGEMSTSEFPKTDADIESVLAGVYQNLNETTPTHSAPFFMQPVWPAMTSSVVAVLTIS